jgi:ferredoxin--NADP+ reductase
MTTMPEGGLGRPLRIAVIGSGPAGFYTVAALTRQGGVPVEVDVFDRLPTPYGLVRGGVAPDHPKIKSVIRVYEKQATHPGVRFFGNVKLGQDLSVEELLACYDQIVYAVGNEKDRRMGIPGEELACCTAATVFVGWYNGHPDYRDAAPNLSCARVAVVGNGNVAIDVTRILARRVDELSTTDIADHALGPLGESQVEEIVVLGRRGPVQSAFTPAELKELTELSDVDVVVDPADLALDAESQAELDASTDNASCRRNYEILQTVAAKGPSGAPRRIVFRFLVSPVEVLGDAAGRVRGVRLERNVLVRAADGTLRPRGTGQYELLEAGQLFASIGYRGHALPGVPFDEQRGVIANRQGRVVDPTTGAFVPNQYVVGWAALGPQGLIGMHKAASGAVADLMLQDASSGTVAPRELRDVVALLEQRGVRYVTFAAWQRIDAAEIARGASRGAPRAKFATIEEMLEVARGAEEKADA